MREINEENGRNMTLPRHNRVGTTENSQTRSGEFTRRMNEERNGGGKTKTHGITEMDSTGMGENVHKLMLRRPIQKQ